MVSARCRHEQHVALDRTGDALGRAAQHGLLELSASQRTQDDELRMVRRGRIGDRGGRLTGNELHRCVGGPVPREKLLDHAPMPRLDPGRVVKHAGRDLHG